MSLRPLDSLPGKYRAQGQSKKSLSKQKWCTFIKWVHLLFKQGKREEEKGIETSDQRFCSAPADIYSESKRPLISVSLLHPCLSYSFHGVKLLHWKQTHTHRARFCVHVLIPLYPHKATCCRRENENIRLKYSKLSRGVGYLIPIRRKWVSKSHRQLWKSQPWCSNLGTWVIVFIY